MTIVTLVGSLAGQLTGSILAAAAVAAAFQPLRQRVQSAVDRLMYGDRREPYLALSRLGARLGRASSPAALLPVIAEGVSDALRVPGTRIELVRGDRVLASANHGNVGTGAGADTFPVLYQDRLVGRMIISHRSPGQGLSGRDRRLLQDLLWQAGFAAHVVGLTSDLQRSRNEAVSAREEERRHIRRDLHDGLGPVLAGLALGLELLIEDDGVGIDTVNGRGLGLWSMAERAAELGGICLIEPLAPSGTRVTARLPVSPP